MKTYLHPLLRPELLCKPCATYVAGSDASGNGLSMALRREESVPSHFCLFPEEEKDGKGVDVTITQLQKKIMRCRQCPRLVAYRCGVAERKVRRFRDADYWGKPVPSFGDPQARLLIIGLAPAAHGGNRTGRAFTGDRSGDWLYEALYAHGFANQPTSVHRQDGLRLKDCYIAQVLHCAPPANTPTRQEIDKCQAYLLTELQLLTRLRVVLPLGKTAFDTYLRACRELRRPLPSPTPHFGHGRLYHLADGVTLVPSYHPSQQNTQTGRLTRAMWHQIFAMVRVLL
jgi:uracil-DNA glycosylase family 4